MEYLRLWSKFKRRYNRGIESLKLPTKRALSNIDELNANIHDVLNKHFKPETNEDSHFLLELVDKISSRIQGHGFLSKQQNFEELVDNHFANHYYNYHMVCGTFALWELQVKILAEKLNVQVWKAKAELNKKQQKRNVLCTREMSTIIDDLNTRINHLRSLELRNIASLRNALLHGNLQELKNTLNSFKSQYRGKNDTLMVMVNTNDAESIVMDEVEDPYEIDSSVVAWFLYGTNSNLLNQVFDIVTKGIKDIKLLIHFEAMCFGELDYLKKKFIDEKKQLTIDDMASFVKARSQSVLFNEEQKDHYLEDLNKLFTITNLK